MSPKEVGALQAIAAAHGGQLTINPTTGLPEAGFLEKLLPMLAGAALTATTGIPAWAIGLGVGGATAAATGSLNKGIMAGLGAYGGGGLGEGLMAAGAAGSAPAAITAAAPNAITSAIPTAAGAVAPAAAADALASTNPVAVAAKAAAPAIQTAAASPSMMENLSSNASQMGKGFQNLGTKQGFDNFIGNAATKTSAATGLGGGMGAFKTAGALAMPMMSDSSGAANKPPEGNIVDYSYDPISGTYRKLRTTPTSQYDSSTMMAAKGGITHALHYAEGGAVSAEEAAAIRAKIQAGPQTNDALDQAFATYTPAQLQAAFPEFGSVESYTTAAADSAARRNAAADSSRETASGAGGSSGFDPNDPKALRALIQKGPQTQDALDAAMLKYTPAQLQAAFPEYGRVSDYNSAAQAAYSRQEAKDTEGRRTNPNYVSTAVGGPIVSKVPQSEIDASQAAAQQAVKDGTLSQDDYDFMVWRQNEINSNTGKKISEDYARQGSNPYDKNNWAQAKEANATAKSRNDLLAQNGQPVQKPDWTVPGYAARQTQRDKDQAARDAAQLAAWNALPPGQRPVVGPFGGGPTGGTPTTGGPTTNGPRVGTVTQTSTPTSKAAMQGFYDQYFTDGVPIGYSQKWAGGDLVKKSANTAYYVDSRGNSHILEKGMDVNNVYAMSPDIAAQWNNEFLYSVDPKTVGPSTGPATTTSLTPYSAPAGLETPFAFSKQGALTSQGVMGGSEKGGTVGNASQIVPAYQQYWQNSKVGDTVDFAGGKLTRTGGAQAVYTGADGKTFSLSPTSDLNIIAANSPAIANTWQQEFGTVPQNYMTGESARGYEFLRGNAPYSVNQQTRGISRPYGEVALGLPGPTFGQTTLNQQAINDATAAKIKDSKVVIPDAQTGYGVTNAGFYNMEQVYDPSTQRYMKNNMFTDPSKDLQAKVANTAGPSNPGTTDPNAGITTGGGGGKNGGLMARGGLSDVAEHYNLGDYSDGGRLLRGPGDGVSDSIPATIGGKREARLADGEFVVPARIVSELGNGSTEAGARQLYAMMDRIQHNRRKSVGKGKVAVNSKSSKFLPA
jgi:hypothetical protein